MISRMRPTYSAINAMPFSVISMPVNMCCVLGKLRARCLPLTLPLSTGLIGRPS